VRKLGILQSTEEGTKMKKKYVALVLIAWLPLFFGHVRYQYNLASTESPSFTGAIDAGGATSLEIPNGTDPDVNASGEISLDTNGAGEPNQVIMRVTDLGGDTQYTMASTLFNFQASVVVPNDMNDTTRDLLPVWHNYTGMQLILTELKAWSETNNTAFNLEVAPENDWTSPTTVAAVTIDQNDVSVPFYATPITSFSHGEIDKDEHLLADFDDVDTPLVVKFSGSGYLIADIN